MATFDEIVKRNREKQNENNASGQATFDEIVQRSRNKSGSSQTTPASSATPVVPKVNLEPNQYTTRVGYTDTASSNYSREDILRMLADAKVAQEQEKQRQKQYGNTAAKVESAYTLPEAPIGTPTVGAEGLIKAAEAAAADRKNKLRADLGYRDESGVYSASNAAADYAKISKATGISEDELRAYAKANDTGAQRQAYTALILNGDMSLDEFKNVSRQYNVSDEDAEGLYAYYGIEGLRQKIREAADSPYKAQGQYEVARYIEDQLKDRGYTAYGYGKGKYIMPAEYAEIILRETNAPEGGYTAENLADYPARALALCAVDVTKNPAWEKEADQIYEILYNNLFDKNEDWGTGGDIWTTVANNIRETARPTAVGIMLGLAKGLGSESIAKLISDDVNEKFDTSYARVSQLAPTATKIANNAGTIGLYIALAYATGGVASSIVGAAASLVGASAASAGVKLATAGLAGAMTFGSVTALQSAGDYFRGNINLAEYGKRVGQSEIVGAATSLVSGLVSMGIDKAFVGRLSERYARNIQQQLDANTKMEMLSSDAVSYMDIVNGNTAPLLVDIKSAMPTMQTSLYLFTRNIASSLAGSGTFVATNALVTGKAPTNEEVAYQFALGFFMTLIRSSFENTRMVENIRSNAARMIYETARAKAGNFAEMINARAAAAEKIGGDIKTQAQALVVELENLRRALRNEAAQYEWTEEAVRELATYDLELAMEQQFLMNYAGEVIIAGAGDTSASAAGDATSTAVLTNLLTTAMEDGITKGAVTPEQITNTALALPAGAESITPDTLAAAQEGATNAGIPYAANQFAQAMAPDSATAPAQISPDNTVEQNLTALAQSPIGAEISENSPISPAENTSEGNLPSAEMDARNAEITSEKEQSWNKIAAGFGENGQKAMTVAYDPQLTSGELASLAEAFTAFYNAGRSGASLDTIPDTIIRSALEVYDDVDAAFKLEQEAVLAGRADAALTSAAENGIIVPQNNEGGNTYGGQESGRDLRLPRVRVRESVQSAGEQGGRVSGASGENQEGRIDSRRGEAGSRNGGQDARHVQEVRAGQKVSPKQLGIKYGTDKQNVVVTPSNETLKTANKLGVKVVAVKGALNMVDDNGKPFRVNAASYVDPETGEHVIVVQADNSKYTERQLLLHEATHEELRQGRVSKKEIFDTINKLANTTKEVWELFNAYAREYGEIYTEKQILEEIFCDAKGAMDRWGVKGAKKAMDAIRRAGGAVYEASGAQATQSKSDAKTSTPTVEEAAFSRNEWHTGMSPQEVQRLERIAKNEINTSTNIIGNTAKWFYTARGDTPYFAVYSTDDTTPMPTILYASKGAKATRENAWITTNIKEMEANGGDDARSTIIDEISVYNRDEQSSNNVDSRQSSDGQRSERDAALYRGASKGNPSRALLNCLGNIARNEAESAGGDGEVSFSRVDDKETLNFLNNQDTVKVYRAMQVIDGKLYPPMAAKVEGSLVEPSELGVWEQADERPDLIRKGNKFKLDKANGSAIEAAYNPYFHTSRSPLNDQFSSAYNRDNLVTVEGEVPVSELTSGYRAEGAKDAVGEMKWHSGPVSSKLAKAGNPRRVILSRWFKPTRIVNDSEVAKTIAGMLDGKGISIPAHTITPSLRTELEKLGVDVFDTKETQGVNFSREDSSGRGLSEGQQEYFKDSKIRDDEGRLQVVYHGTEADFTVFDTSIQGGKNGEAEGFGIYITPSKAVTEHYGGRQMEMYANITKPARSDVKTIGVMKLAKLIESTARAEAKALVEEEGYDTISDALKDTWISNCVNTYDMPINVAYTEVAQWILGAESGDMGVVQEVMAGMGIRDYEDAMDFYREHLVPVTGFDGFATAWENRETGNKVPIYLAFESSQLKNVDNLNPTKNEDIRYSAEEGINADLAEQLKQLRSDLKKAQEERDKARGQFKRTTQPTVRRDDVKKIARDIINRFGSKARVETITDEMEKLANLITRQGDEQGDATYTRVSEAAADIMYGIIANSDDVYDADAVEVQKKIRDTLRNTKVYVSSYERGDAALNNDSYEQFRKQNFGRVQLTSDPKALHIDTLYGELCEQFPWMFDTELTNQGDMLREMLEVSERPLQPTYNIAEEAEYEADDLMWRLMEEVRQVETFADKAARKQALAVAHESNKYNAQKEKNAELRRQIAEERAKNRDKLDALRKQRDRIIAEMKEHYREQKVTQRELKERREAEDRLLGMLRRVNNTKLSTPNRAWFEQYFGNIYTVAKHLTGNKLATAQDLQNKYAELKDNDPDFIGSQRLEEDLAAILDKRKDIASMTDEEIGDYTYVLLEFLHQVQEGNKMTRIADRTDVRMQAYNVMSNVISTKGAPAFGVVKQIQDAVITNALDALRAVRRYTGYNDSDPLYLRTRELAEGQRAADMYIAQAKAAFSNLLSDKKFVRFFTGPHAAEIEIRGTDANTNESVTLKITPALRTGLYLNNQNDDNRRHITYGGVIIPDIGLLKKGKISEAFARGTRVKFTPKEMTAITSGMTKEELDFARLTNSYFGETSPRAISEVYEELHGVPPKMVGAGYYPLKVADGWTRGNADTIDINAMAFDSPNDIGGPGWLKERKESIAPIYLFPADMVVNRSINDHGRYVGLAIPADNFNKLWEAKLYKKETRYNKLKGLDETYFAPDKALKDVIAGKWGTRAKNNINSFFNQILGRESRMRDTRFGRFRSRYARSVLELNPSVALKQMPSGIAAAAVVGYAPLAKAVNPALKIDTSFIDKMTASYLIRKEGYSQQELGELAQRGKKLPPALSWIIGADLATTGMLKRAAAFYVRDNMKELEVGAEAYKKAVVEVYDNIISETQPTYDVIYRANVLRTTSEITRALNMFRTQPFKNFNILYDALGNLQAKRNAYHEANRWATDDEQSQRYAEEAKAAYHDAKKRAVWAFTSQAASGMLISLIMAGWDMLRGKKKKYADEDGEVTFWSFLKGLGLNFASTGAGMIPYGGFLLDGVETLVDAVSGDDIFDTTMYGFSVPEVDLLNDTASGVVNLVRSLRAAFTAEDGADWEKIGRSLYSATEQIAQFMGIPLQNARKTVEVMARQVFKSEGEYVGEYVAARVIEGNPLERKSECYTLLYKAKQNDAEQYNTLYEQMIKDGFKEDDIRDAMNKKIAADKGLKSTTELADKDRYLSPSQQKTYDSVTRRVKSSEVWADSSSSSRAKLNELAYDVIAGSKRNSWQSESVTTENDLTQTEYILYKLALDIVDKPNSNGNYGTYTDAEKAEAVKMAKRG